MADIAGALRSIIQSIFHLSNAHDQLAAISPTGNPMGQGSVAQARQGLAAALALLDAPEPADQAPAEPAPPPDPPPPAVEEPPPSPPPAPPEDQAPPDPAQPAESATDPADISAGALNAEEAASNPTGETPPAPPVS